MNFDPEFLAAALKTGLALVVVLGTVWGLGRVLKGPLAQGRGHGGGVLRMRASLPVGLKKQVALVEVPGKILVLGISQDRVTCLDRIEDEELIQQITAEAPHTLGPSFKALLRRANGQIHSPDTRRQHTGTEPAAGGPVQ